MHGLLLLLAVAGLPADKLDAKSGLPANAVRIGEHSLARPPERDRKPGLRAVKVRGRDAARVREWRDGGQLFAVLWLPSWAPGGGGYRAAMIVPDERPFVEQLPENPRPRRGAPPDEARSWHYEALAGDSWPSGRPRVHGDLAQAAAAVEREWRFLTGRKAPAKRPGKYPAPAKVRTARRGA